MPDRSDYLARILINRMRSLEETLDDQPGTALDARRRIELVEKVMVIEAGVLDGATHRMVLAAMPPVKAVPDRELHEFAAFLRQRLPAGT